jgi:hypothetical protein
MKQVIILYCIIVVLVGIVISKYYRVVSSSDLLGKAQTFCSTHGGIKFFGQYDLICNDGTQIDKDYL